MGTRMEDMKTKRWPQSVTMGSWAISQLVLRLDWPVSLSFVGTIVNTRWKMTGDAMGHFKIKYYGSFQIMIQNK